MMVLILKKFCFLFMREPCSSERTLLTFSHNYGMINMNKGVHDNCERPFCIYSRIRTENQGNSRNGGEIHRILPFDGDHSVTGDALARTDCRNRMHA